MDDDERFGTLFHRAVGTLEPPTERLVEGAVARGRRQRRWIRGAELGTGVAVLAGVAVIGATFLGSGDGAAPHRGSPAAVGDLRGSTPTTVVMTPQALLRTALDTLPRPGATTGYSGNFMDGFVSASFLYTAGGTAEVDVSMTYPPAVRSPKSAVVTPCTAGSAGCTVLPDGAHVTVRQAHQYNDGRTPSPMEWDVDLVRADGVQISVVEYNAPQGKGAASTRATPPFSIAELTAWADLDEWRVRIPASQAAAAAHLFTPVDIDGPTVRAATRNERLAACRAAARVRKIDPHTCTAGG